MIFLKVSQRNTPTSAICHLHKPMDKWLCEGISAGIENPKYKDTFPTDCIKLHGESDNGGYLGNWDKCDSFRESTT